MGTGSAAIAVSGVAPHSGGTRTGGIYPPPYLLVRSATCRRAGATSVRPATGATAVVLVLLPKRRRLLPIRSGVPGKMDHGSAEGSIGGRCKKLTSYALVILPD